MNDEALKKTKGEAGDAELQFISFKLSGEEFGVEIEKVREILKTREITPIPKAPEYFMGIMNLRGNIIPVLDMKLRLNLEQSETTDKTRILVINLEDDFYGIMVDEVSEVQRIQRSKIEPPPQVTRGIDKFYLDGVVKISTEGRLIMMLNLAEVLNIEIVKKQKYVTDTKQRLEAKEMDKEKLEEEQLVTFYLDEEEFGINIYAIKEILKVGEITSVPNVPDYVIGIQNVRDNIIPIIDMRKIVNLQSLESLDRDHRVLIVEVARTTIGLLVDKVSEVMRIRKNLVDTAPSVVSSYGREIRGIAKLDEGSRLIMILDEKLIITSDEAAVISQIQEENVQAEVKMKEESLQENQYVIFSIYGEEFGISIDKVQEIFRVEEITNVPRAPAFMKGVVNLRGNIIPVVDIRLRFGITDVSSEYKDLLNEIITLFKNEKLKFQKVISDKKATERSYELENTEIYKFLESYKTSNENIFSGINDIKSAYEELFQKVKQAVDLIREGDDKGGQGMVEKLQTTDFEHFENFINDLISSKNLGLQKSEKILVVTIRNIVVGLLVDSVHEVLRVADSLVEDAPSLAVSSVDLSYLEGIAKLDQGERIILLLNINDIMDEKDFIRLRKVKSEQLKKRQAKQDKKPEPAAEKPAQVKVKKKLKIAD